MIRIQRLKRRQVIDIRREPCYFRILLRDGTVEKLAIRPRGYSSLIVDQVFHWESPKNYKDIFLEELCHFEVVLPDDTSVNITMFRDEVCSFRGNEEEVFIKVLWGDLMINGSLKVDSDNEPLIIRDSSFEFCPTKGFALCVTENLG